MRRHALGALLVLAWMAAAATPSLAEPIFLSRQYARCTNCHFSPTGGGLLTPYGRALSREELSTFGRSRASQPPGSEEEFLFGLLGDALGPVSLGIALRPSHLDFDFGGFSSTRDFLMNAEVSAALQHKSWTFYGQVGRQPRGDDNRVKSFEHWVGFQSGSRLGVRAGRFVPAYGIKYSDHTTFSRAPLGLDNDDQVYGLELSFNGDRHLVQASVGPGFADSEGEESRRSFTASTRWQFDLKPNLVLVGSGLYRDASDQDPRHGSAGLAVGLAPASRLTLWAQADARFRSGTSGDPGYTLIGDAAFEVYRGLWVSFSPQLRTDIGDSTAGVVRLKLGLTLLLRTHWNVVGAYFRDKDRKTDRVSETWLAQLHLYL